MELVTKNFQKLNTYINPAWMALVSGLRLMCRVISNILLSYIVPIFNIIIIIGMRPEDTTWHYSVTNIILATNACFIIGITNYFKINKQYNNIINFLKMVGLTISIGAFVLLTYEIESNSVGNIVFDIYLYSVIISFCISFILCVLSQKENTAYDKVVDEKIDESSAKPKLVNGDTSVLPGGLGNVFDEVEMEIGDFDPEGGDDDED